MKVKKDQAEEFRKLQALLDANKEASGVFDSIPAAKGEEAELEEPICGPEAGFSSAIGEMSGAEMIMQSENGNKVLRVVSKLLFWR